MVTVNATNNSKNDLPKNHGVAKLIKGEEFRNLLKGRLLASKEAIGLFKWNCVEVHYTCACVNICGEFSSTAQLVTWYYYWESVWCPEEVESNFA